MEEEKVWVAKCLPNYVLYSILGVETPPETTLFILEKIIFIWTNDRYDIAFPEIFPRC